MPEWSRWTTELQDYVSGMTGPFDTRVRLSIEDEHVFVSVAMNGAGGGSLEDMNQAYQDIYLHVLRHSLLAEEFSMDMELHLQVLP